MNWLQHSSGREVEAFSDVLQQGFQWTSNLTDHTVHSNTGAFATQNVVSGPAASASLGCWTGKQNRGPYL